MCVSDTTWRDLLVNLWYGHVQPHYLSILCSLIVARSHPAVDFNTKPWTDTALVTSWHAVCRLWNQSAAQEWCWESGEQLFICTAEDRIGGQELTLVECYSVALHTKNKKQRRTKDLPHTIVLTKGMKVLVMDNIETDLDVINGTQGVIVDIILHADEPPIGNGPIVHLKWPPVYVLVKLTHTWASKLDRLEDMVIPIEVQTMTMRVKVQTALGKVVTCTMHCKQYLKTAAYSFMDYWSQSQTIPYVIIDIASPPHGTLTLFNLYVALSQSSGRGTIWLLWNFDDRVFMQLHDSALTLENDRLEELNRLTEVWWREMGWGRNEN